MNFIKGETWQPQIDVILNDDAFDCTGFDVYIHIKDKTKDKYIHITWTNRPQGKGFFDLTHGKSKDLKVGSYDFEVNLVKEDGTFKKVLRKDVLEVTETLNPEIEER